MTRIAVAGFQHETNSFAKGQAGLTEFEMADSWPGLLRGAEVIAGTRGINLPIAGFAAAAEARGVEVIPILWCAAEPSGPVADAAFDRITADILDGIKAAGPVDGVYLDLHGAMITESLPDGEGEVLARLRARFGAELPVAVSLDMHANVSERFVGLADVVRIFRTYPHLDMAKTGARCLAPLLEAVAGKRPCKAFRRAPYLIPLHAQYTGDGPVGRLYAQAAARGVEFAVGFTAGDTPYTAPSLIAFADTQEAAEVAADALLADLVAAEPDLSVPLPTAAEGVEQAMAYPSGKPVVIADVEDNPGGGGSSDTTGLLKALVAKGTKGALLGLLHDPDAAAAAHRAGVGAELEVPLGGRSGCPGDSPMAARVRVDALSDGAVVYEGEMYGGGVAQVGASAALRILADGCDVVVAVSSVRNQCLDRGYFRFLGLEPETARILAVKSTVHHRAEFDPISQASLAVCVPGALASDLTRPAYRHLLPGLRLGPGGPEFGRER